ncbi:hypothetical protein RclHR1_05570002 [Rhizophagus clarus]|uniref:DDE-1 domain-containing protein n=1 Tax=Rhizophagus clarus TaxID=94130 RepID=A0A2Z6RPP1_9GLOM|nr:hypothetical protein RclHR1_05570002 [Rhizophagus clarus]
MAILLKVQPGVKRLNTEVKLKYPALETALLTWVKEKRKNQNAVTQSMIQMKAKALAQQHQWQAICSGVGSFAFIEKQQEFLSYIMYRHIQYDYSLAYISNMDKMPVSFDLPSNTTIDELGARSVSIHTTGHEKANFTVVLTCMADGTKFFLLIIFKLKNVSRENFPPETKRERISNLQSLLVLDSFSAYIVDSVKRHFGKKNTNITIIPGELTSRLQPLDVSVNKSFKTKWMAKVVKELTPTSNLKKPSYETVANWVRDSWNAIDVDLIRKSFKCCGISNKCDRTKDDWIFNYNRLRQGNQLGDKVEIPSDDERGNEKDKERETDDEYVGKKGEMDEETDKEYVDEKEETDEEYVDEGGKEDEEEEYEGEEDEYDDEYYSYYDQGTNYVNVWDD